MSNLEQDLQQAQRALTLLLNQYESASEDIIRSNFTAQLHSLLDGIASFDITRLKECMLGIKDEAASHYLQLICDKIKSAEQPKPPPNERLSKSVDKPAAQVKRESRLEKKENAKNGGIFEYVRNKFSSKEKKATEMIFPEEQPKCYYDPVTKTYVFEGQQPEAPKVLQKPPSASAKKTKEEVKKTNDESELGQLTAPPAFKRKSTPATNLKGKVRIKEEIEVAREAQPITFAKVMQTLNESYNSLIEKANRGVYERHVQVSNQNPQNYAQIASFSQRLLEASQEISTHEHKLIEKWGRLLASESRELKIMQKVIKEIGDSAQTYSAVLSKLDGPVSQRQQRLKEEVVFIKDAIKQAEKEIIRQIIIKEVPVEKETSDHSSQTEWQQPKHQQKTHHDQSSIRRQLQQANRKYFNSSLKLSDISEQKERLQHLVKRYQSKIQHLQASIREKQSMAAYLTDSIQEAKQIINELTRNNELLSDKVKRQSEQIKSHQERQKRLLSEHSQEVNQLTIQYKAQIQRNIAQIAQLQSANYALKQQKNVALEQLRQERARKDGSIDKVTAEIAKQKTKIQSQLQLYEQREKMYVSSLQRLQDQSALMQDYDAALSQQNQLLNAILAKRLQLSKNPQNDETFLTIKPSQEPSSHAIILQLSEIVNSITETHLDRLQNYNRYCTKLQKKYLDTKQAYNKIKSSVANENLSLNRSVTRLKGLLQTYKTAKEEAEERCAQLQLQCDKLKKKLQHYKQEDHFNKSYLSRIKNSKIYSQNESMMSLQEDKDELASQLDELQREIRQKDQALKKSQADLEDLLASYEKNQARVLQIEKKYKQNEKQLRRTKQQLQETSNDNKLLELKLQNFKDKCEQLQNREESRAKNAENALQKKVKLIRNDLDQSTKREEHLRTEIEQLKQESKQRLAALQESHQGILSTLTHQITEKEGEVGEVILLLEETNQQLQRQQQEKATLSSKYKQLIETQAKLNAKIGQIVDHYEQQIATHRQYQRNATKSIEALNEKCSQLSDDQAVLCESYSQRISQLEQALQSSIEDSKELQGQIQQYSQLLRQASHQLDCAREEHKQNNQLNRASKQAAQKIQQLEELLQLLKGQLDEKTTQNQNFQEIIEKMSDEMARLSSNAEQLAKDKTDLQEKLMYKERELQTLSNQVNKKSQELMIKTEELVEKDQALLQQAELSVMRKEELDQVKNQLLKITFQLRQRDKQVEELTADLQQLAEELANGGNEDQTQAIQKLEGQVDAMRKAITLKDQQIANFASNLYGISAQLQQKTGEIERCKADLSANANNIEEMNTALVEMSNSLQQAQWRAATLQRQSNQQQSIVTELQSKLSSKEAQLALLLERLALAEKEINKQVDQADEIEGEMEYLLQEISNKEKQLESLAEQYRLKNFEHEKLVQKYDRQSVAMEAVKKQLAQALLEKQDLRQLQEKFVILSSQHDELMKYHKTASQEVPSLKALLVEREKEKHELLQLITTLEKQVQNERENSDKANLSTQSQAKQETVLIEKLIADIKQKEQAVFDLEGQLQEKDRAIRHLHAEGQLNEEQIRQTKRTLAEKSKLLTETQISEQQKLRIIVQLEKSLKEGQEKYNQLEGNLAEMAEVIESQEGLIETLKNQGSSKDTTSAIGQPNAEIAQKNTQVAQLKRRLEDTKNASLTRERQYQRKIEALERENILITALKNSNKKLQETVKTLQDENKMLTTEKVELMKSNDYLVGINQKLIADKSPHNPKEQPKHAAPAVEKPNHKMDADPPNMKEAKEGKEGKKEASGIFGALSSLFLTPTETDRLRK